MDYFRLIRTIVVPESIPQETNGVNWVEKSGGLLFGFETDEEGKEFELREIYCEYNAGRAESSPGIGGVVFKNSTAIPTYGSQVGERDYIYSQIALGKNGNMNTGWEKIEAVANDKYVSYGANGKSSNIGTVTGLTKMFANTYIPFRKISIFIQNEAAYGLLPGSIFTFYGR